MKTVFETLELGIRCIDNSMRVNIKRKDYTDIILSEVGANLRLFKSDGPIQTIVIYKDKVVTVDHGEEYLLIDLKVQND